MFPRSPRQQRVPASSRRSVRRAAGPMRREGGRSRPGTYGARPTTPPVTFPRYPRCGRPRCQPSRSSGHSRCTGTRPPSSANFAAGSIASPTHSAPHLTRLARRSVRRHTGFWRDRWSRVSLRYAVTRRAVRALTTPGSRFPRTILDCMVRAEEKQRRRRLPYRHPPPALLPNQAERYARDLAKPLTVTGSRRRRSAAWLRMARSIARGPHTTTRTDGTRPGSCLGEVEATTGIEPVYAVLQTAP